MNLKLENHFEQHQLKEIAFCPTRVSLITLLQVTGVCDTGLCTALLRSHQSVPVMSRIFPNNQTVENSCLKKPKSRRVSTIQAKCWYIRSVFSTVTRSMLNSTVTSSAMLQQCMKSCSNAGDFWPHQLDLCLRFVVIIGFYSV